MNMLTCVVTVKFVDDDINCEIRNKLEEGWYLRGTPIPVGTDLVLLTFEKMEETEVICNDSDDLESL